VRAHDRAAPVSQSEVARGGRARHNPPMSRPRGALAPGRLRVPRSSPPTSGSSRASRPQWVSPPRTTWCTASTRWPAVALGFVGFVRRPRAPVPHASLHGVDVLVRRRHGRGLRHHAADVLHVGFGVPYFVSTTFYAIVLVAVFFAWDRVEDTLSIHSITTPRRELFYWAAVVATFALGTALGDLTATTLHLGYFKSMVLFAVIIAVPAIGYWRFDWNPVFSFWARTSSPARSARPSPTGWASPWSSAASAGATARSASPDGAHHRLRRLSRHHAHRRGPAPETPAPCALSWASSLS